MLVVAPDEHVLARFGDFVSLALDVACDFLEGRIAVAGARPRSRPAGPRPEHFEPLFSSVDPNIRERALPYRPPSEGLARSGAEPSARKGTRRRRVGSREPSGIRRRGGNSLAARSEADYTCPKYRFGVGVTGCRAWIAACHRVVVARRASRGQCDSSPARVILLCQRAAMPVSVDSLFSRACGELAPRSARCSGRIAPALRPVVNRSHWPERLTALRQRRSCGTSFPCPSPCRAQSRSSRGWLGRTGIGE